MIRANDPAFPSSAYGGPSIDVRTWLAGQALAALRCGSHPEDIRQTAANAVRLADAVLAVLNGAEAPPDDDETVDLTNDE